MSAYGDRGLGILAIENIGVYCQYEHINNTKLKANTSLTLKSRCICSPIMEIGGQETEAHNVLICHSLLYMKHTNQ